jgi:hypothetical protein
MPAVSPQTSVRIKIMSEEQQMRKVIFAINITIDGYCGHEADLL